MREEVRLGETGGARPYVVAVAAALLGVGLWRLLTPLIRDDHPFLLPLLAVIVSAWYGGLWPGVTALAVAVAALGVAGPRAEEGGHLLAGHPFGLGLFAAAGVCCALLGQAQLTSRRRAEDSLAALRREVDLRLAAEAALRERVLGYASALEAQVGERTHELRRSNDELEKFAYVASHDLQEPLRKIQAFGDRLVRKCKDQVGEQGLEYLDRMLAAAARMRQLIDDLLTFSRVTTKPQVLAVVDLGEVVRGVVGDLEHRLGGADGRVEVGELPALRADPSQMRQLFQNLIANALKFRKPDVAPVVTVAAEPRPGGWRIRVSDNGIGFEPAYAARIFELFQRLHGRGEYEGTGLGLAICRKIAERHGGSIEAHGRPGDGATFVIDLPADPAPANPERTSVP